jgi:hypothetical protein
VELGQRFKYTWGCDMAFVRNDIVAIDWDSSTITNMGTGSAEALDFTRGMLPSGLTFTRSSNATRVNTAGQIEYAPSNQVIREASLATVGDLAGAGLLPSSWVTNGGGAGITRAIVGVGVLPDGRGYFDYRVSGTNLSGGILYCGFRSVANTQTPGAIGQVWTASVYTKVIAGSFAAGFNPGGDGTISVVMNNSGGSYISEAASASKASTTEQRQSVTHKLATVGTSFVAANFNIAVSIGATVDVTVRVSGAQLQIGGLTEFVKAAPGSAYYGPRFDYDPATLALLGLLIEGQATNLAPYSGETPANLGVSFVTATTAPSSILGRPTVRVTADGTANPHFVFAGTLAAAPAATTVHTASAYLKAGTAQFAQVFVSASYAALDVFVTIDLSTGAFQAGAGASSVVAQNCGSGVWRLSFAFTTSAAPSAAAGTVVCIASSLADARSPAVTTSAYIDVMGMQLETGSFPTSYIPTFGAAATRAAETCTASTAGWLTPSQGTLVCQWSRQAIPGSALTYNATIAMIGDGSTNNLGPRCGSGTPSQQRVDVLDAGVSQVSMGLPTGVASTVYKLAFAWQANDFRGAVGGVPLIPDTGGTVPPSLTTLYVGNYSGNAPLNGTIRNFTYYSSAVPNTTLQTLTL